MAGNMTMAEWAVAISGNGTTEGAHVVLPSAGRTNRLHRIRELKLRQATGNMSACTVHIVTNGVVDTAIASVADEDIAVEVSPGSVTQSATVAFVDTPIEGFNVCRDSIEVRIDGITATGDWTIVGHVVAEVF